jgi:hypothetical protein
MYKINQLIFIIALCCNSIVKAESTTTTPIEQSVYASIDNNLKIKVRVYLQGPLMNTIAKSVTNNRPLMRADFVLNPASGETYLPVKDPYKAIYLSMGRFCHHGSGTYSKYDSIPDAKKVFSQSGDDAIVDWVLVELRPASDMTAITATRAGLLQRDGDIVDLDGESALEFESIPSDKYYLAIKHRNHLGVMSKYALSPEILENLVDFTNPNFETYDKGIVNGINYSGLAQNQNLKAGYACMWGGDLNSDGKVKYENPNDDTNQLINDVKNHPLNTDLNITFNNAYGYFSSDFDMNGKVKYSNPNDDTNYMFAQIYFYPLNSNGSSNYSLFVEQLP